ncbi:PPPDE putative thiol peptidase family protein [Actinidia rufa]|uniref:PPPDE putative thiol peptidase family protein n=1 Tax=Actinidia rufa TaxID=165716 RepID=A0A7J0ECG0_9ERIC|nr:PPPDE putative thiol peptidase family protein [Actinidia rufa]
MTEVILHIYDVTNSDSDKTNNTIVQINKIFKDGFGLGGIFHSAVQMECVTDHGWQVYGDEEWSFGYCEQGTGVFSCPPGKNPMYTYRECIVLGKTNFSIFKINKILRELSWVNRFAHAGDAAAEIAGTTALRFRQAKTEIVSASKVAYRFLAGVTSNSSVTSASSGNSNRGTPRFQANWFGNLISNGAKPSSSSELENEDAAIFGQQQRQDEESPLRQNSRHDI